MPSLPSALMKHGSSAGRRCAEDLADIAAAANVRTVGTDTNNVIGRGDVEARTSAQGDIVVADGVAKERSITDSRVKAAIGIVKKRLQTVGRVVAAGGIAKKRLNTSGCV